MASNNNQSSDDTELLQFLTETITNGNSERASVLFENCQREKIQSVSILKKVSEDNLSRIGFGIGEITQFQSSNKSSLASQIALSVEEIKAKYFGKESQCVKKKSKILKKEGDPHSTMIVYVGLKSRGKKKQKKKQVKKIGGGIHEIKMTKTETSYQNIMSAAKKEFGLLDEMNTSLEVGGKEMSDFVDRSGCSCLFSEYLKENGIYSSRCKIYLVTEEKVIDSGFVTDIPDSNIDDQGTTYSVQDITVIDPICITYRIIENDVAVTLVGKVSVIERESCRNPDILSVPSHDINPLQLSYKICVLSKGHSKYVDWKPTEDGTNTELVFPNAKENDEFIIHGPDEIHGYELCDFILGIVVKCWNDEPFVEWVCDGSSYQSANGLYVVNIRLPGLYFAKVTYNQKEYTSCGVCVFEKDGFLQIGHVIQNIPMQFKSQNQLQNESNKESVFNESVDSNQQGAGCSSENFSGYVPSVSLSDFQIGDEIGRGNFGTVYKGSWLGTDVAVKKIPIGRKGKSAQVNVVKNEIQMLSRLRHPNLVQIMAYSLQASKAMLLFEFMEGCVDLDEIIFPSGEPKMKLNNEDKVNVSLQTAQGLAYLHGLKPPIIHQDVKPSNILVSKTLMVKICDLGISRLRTMHTQACGSTIKLVEGTPVYMSPECLLKKSRSTTASDMWSYFCTILELFTEKDVWDLEANSLSSCSSSEPKDMIILQSYLERQERPHALQYAPSSVPQVLLDIIQNGLLYDVKKRPTAVEVVHGLIHYQTKCTRCHKKDQ